MKILFVGDNRNRANYGCRATSMALAALMAREHTISAIIDGKETMNNSMTPVPWGGARPYALWSAIDAWQHGRFRGLMRATKSRLGIVDDFVDEDPDTSIQRFLKVARYYPVLKQIHADVAACDAIVVNGEGTYIFSTPPRRDTLFYNFILRLGQTLGKRTYMVNAMLSDCPRSAPNQAVIRHSAAVLNACDGVTLRDPQSLEYAASMGLNANARHLPDALFTWHAGITAWQAQLSGSTRLFEPFEHEFFESLPELDLNQPYLCLSGTSSAAWRPQEAAPAYARLLDGLKTLGLPVLVLPTCTGDEFLRPVAAAANCAYLPPHIPIRIGAAILARAAAYVSGRFHPAVLASCGGTPCVFMGSNSHKTLSLQRMLNYRDPIEYDDIPDANNVEKMVAHTRRILDSDNRMVISQTAHTLSQQATGLLDVLKPIHHSK